MNLLKPAHRGCPKVHPQPTFLSSVRKTSKRFDRKFSIFTTCKKSISHERVLLSYHILIIQFQGFITILSHLGIFLLLHFFMLNRAQDLNKPKILKQPPPPPPPTQIINQCLDHKCQSFFPLINVKMTTIVGNLTFMSRINFGLTRVEHEKCFTTWAQVSFF